MKELAQILKNEFKDKETAHIYVNEFLNASIATQIKVLREQRDLTQKELALLAGMKQSRISLLETINYDKWSISTLKKFADTFDVALKVSFVPFSQRIRDIVNFDRGSLEVKSRMSDLASTVQPETETKVSLSHRAIATGPVGFGATTNPIDIGSYELTGTVVMASDIEQDFFILPARTDKKTQSRDFEQISVS